MVVIQLDILLLLYWRNFQDQKQRYLQIDFTEGGGREQVKECPLSLIFDLDNKIDTTYNTIYLLRTAKEEDDDDQEKEDGLPRRLGRKESSPFGEALRIPDRG